LVAVPVAVCLALTHALPTLSVETAVQSRRCGDCDDIDGTACGSKAEP